MAKTDPRLDSIAWGGSETGEVAWIQDEEIALMNQARKTRVSTLLYGRACFIYAQDGEWALVAGVHDNYLGWVKNAHFTRMQPQNPKRIRTASTFVFPEPDIKTVPVARLPFGSWIDVLSEEGKFVQIRNGFVFADHLKSNCDAVDFALEFLDVPYLWGGGSVNGIDCSGLTQICYSVVGKALLRDTDQQEAQLTKIEKSERKRGDLVYWKGHVGILEDEDTLIHATAFAMKTIWEDLDKVIARVGEPSSFRRAR